jgi:hypothetical protein
MNQLVQELISPFLTEAKIQKGIALVPGKYKPPHKGHLFVVQELLKDPRIKAITVLISPRVVNGITPELSKEIWEKYLQKYGIKAKVLISNEPSPVKATVNIIKNNPDNFYYVVTGYRTEEDLKDLARGNFTKNYGNAEAIAIEGEDIRAARVRKLLAQRNFDGFALNLPTKLTKAEKEQIYNKLIQVVPAEVEGELTEIQIRLSNHDGQVLPGDRVRAPKGAFVYNKSTGKKQILKQAKVFKVIENNRLGVNRYKLNLEDQKGNKFWVMNYEMDGEVNGKSIPQWSMVEGVINESKDPYGVNAYTLELTKLRENDIYLDIPKFNQPKTIQHYLIESINEISLSKENAVDINGDLTGGTFTVGDVTYEYSIKNIPNPYEDLGLFYNIQFTPKGEVVSIPKGGKENYIKILSTMYKIIVDFLEKQQPEYVGISSLDNSGGKNYHTVYNRLTTNNLNLIPGYFRKDSNLQFDSPEGKGRFIVLKKKNSNLKEDIKKLDEVKLKDLITKLKTGWKDFIKAIKQEGKETQEAFVLLNQAAQGKITLTPEQKKQIGNQMKDVLKTLGYVIIFSLPGGSIVTILLKVLKLNKYVLPSAFLTEGKYDFEVTTQTRYIINQLKNNLGEKYTETTEGQVKGVDYDLTYNFIPNDEDGFDYDVYGDTTEGDEDKLDELTLNIEYNINSIPNLLNDLIANVKNTLRHELEHIAQFNIQGKVEPGEEEQEDLYIVDYLTSPDEVEAFVQGLYKQAKTQKLPLPQVIEDYLDQNIDDFETKEDYDRVYNTWINWAKKNLPKAQLQESNSLVWPHQESLVTLSKYLMKELDIEKVPNIELKEDDENAKNVLGKTAYYNPSTYTITLYITDRHPKDILRSFSHEMIHHKQNLDGRLENITTTNTNEDDELTEIEREAYELGNILFRNWEDKIKND